MMRVIEAPEITFVLRNSRCNGSQRVHVNWRACYGWGQQYGTSIYLFY